MARRVDWRVGQGTFMGGVVVNQPFTRYRATRPRHKWLNIPEADLPEPDEPGGLSSELEASVQKIEHSIEWMDKLLTPRPHYEKKPTDEAVELMDHMRMPGHSFAEEDSTYHDEMTNAFTVAIISLRSCSLPLRELNFSNS